MPKSYKVQLSALNITTHPHSSENYSKLWIEAFGLNRAVKLHGDNWGMIGTAFSIVSDDPKKGIQGDFYRFTNIDENADWFDVKRKEAVSPEEADDLVSIPDNLKPNLRRVRYVFFPEKHRLVFASSFSDNHMPSNLAVKLVSTILNDQRLSDLAPNASVRAEQSKEAIDSIFSNIQLQHLKIVVEIPNGDDDGEDEESIESVLDEQRVKRVSVELTAQKNQAIQPNKRNKHLAYLAASNGHVEAKGVGADGESKQVNTEEYPVKVTEYFDERLSFADWFIDSANKILQSF